MNICHFMMSKQFAGIEQHVIELATYQSSKHNVTLICNKEMLKYIPRHINSIPIKNYSRRSIIGIIKIYRILKENKFEILHTHASKPTYIATILKKCMKQNVIATIHNKKSHTKYYKKADKVIAVCRGLISNNKEKVKIIHNWHNTRSIKIMECQRKKYILAIGRLEKQKGFDLLIKSWRGINDNLLILGEGSERDNLIELIREHKLENKIEIKPAVKKEAMADIYKNASCLIVSSRYEGGPRVALEALASNIPVLSTKVGHMIDLLPNKFMTTPGDSEKLEKLIKKYIGKEINQGEIFEIVKNEYSLEKKALEISSLYREQLNESREHNREAV